VICLARQRRCQNAIPITWLLRARPITFGAPPLCRTHFGVKRPGQSLLGHPGCAKLILASTGQANHFWGTPAVSNSFWRRRARPITFGAPRLCQTHFGVGRPRRSVMGHYGTQFADLRKVRKNKLHTQKIQLLERELRKKLTFKVNSFVRKVNF
jgi:hypothetical protein